MRVLVLVKPAVEASELGFQDDMTIRRDGASVSITLADAHAISIARRMKREESAEYDVLSLYPGYPSRILKELTAYECSAVYQVADDAFRGGDTLATACALMHAVKELERRNGSYDLIIAGNASTDSETGQVPAELAALLDRPIITHATEISGDCITRLLEDRTDVLRVCYPAIVSICPKGLAPDPPSLKGRMNASKVPFIHLSSREIGADPESIGFKGSQTRVVSVHSRSVKWRNAEKTTDPRVGARWIMDEVDKKRSCLPKPGRCSRGYLSDEALVLVPLFDSEGYSASLEIISELASRRVRPHAVCCGSDCVDRDGIERAGAVALTFLRQEHSDDDSVYGHAFACFLDRKDSMVFAPATIRMRSIVPYAAALVSAGLAADCTDFSIEAGKWTAIRPAFEGSTEAEVAIISRPAIMTIRPHAFSIRDYGSMEGSFASSSIQYPQCKDRVLIDSSEVQAASEERNGAVMISIGAGIGDRDLRERLFSFGCSMGASRTGVNLYSLPYALQVGLTGRIVHPEAYIAFGISGAPQHITGISGAGTIISVNKDPKAPIISFSDKAIIADAAEVVEAMEEIRRNGNGV